MKKLNVKYIPLLLGVYAGVGVFLFIDAWISVSQIDMNDSSTWPNMHPWIRIYLIPVIGTVFAVIVSIVELIRNFIWKTNIERFILWFLLGVSYTIVLIGFAFSRILPFGWSIFSMVLVVVAVNPILIHFLFGRKKLEKVKPAAAPDAASPRRRAHRTAKAEHEH